MKFLSWETKSAALDTAALQRTWMWRSLTGQWRRDVSKQPTAFIFKVQQVLKVFLVRNVGTPVSRDVVPQPHMHRWQNLKTCKTACNEYKSCPSF